MVEITDLQRKKFKESHFYKKVRDELRKMWTKRGKQNWNKTEAEQNKGSQLRLTDTFVHFHSRYSVSLNLEETMGWILLLNWQGTLFSIMWFNN